MTTISEAASRHLWMHFTRLTSAGNVPVIVRGEGCSVWDDQGKRYLDGLSGLFTVQIGHGRAELAEAARAQSETLAYFPVWGFALMWAGIALAVTVRTARAHLPFTLTWWSFTFPVGTVVTGTSGLALHTGETFLQVAAVMLFAALLGAWATVALRTARGVLTGALLR